MADEQVAAILRALAELVPRDRSANRVLDVTAAERSFLWLGLEAIPNTVFEGMPLAPPAFVAPTALAAALRGHEVLHLDDRPIRFGWLYLCGPVEVDGKLERLSLPLLSRPVTMHLDEQVGYRLEGLGDVRALGDLAAEPPPYLPTWGPDPSSEQLRASPELRAWIDGAVFGAGYPPVTDVVGPSTSPAEARLGPDLVAVVGCGLHIEVAPPRPPRQSALLAWTEVRGIGRTAMAEVYGTSPRGPVGSGRLDDDRVVAPLPLTAAQKEVVERSRVEPVTVISGAPGNGKSHAVCAIAVDAVTQSSSVLVVAPTPHAADVLAELLARQPGPPPVLFGEADGRRAMLTTLNTMQYETMSPFEVHRLRRDAESARFVRRNAQVAVGSALELELRAARGSAWQARLDELRAAAPAAFEASADLGTMEQLLRHTLDWPRGWRRRRFRKKVGASPEASLDVLADALIAARDVRTGLELPIRGGTTIGAAWDALLAAEQREAAAEGALADGMARDETRWLQRGRRAAASLAASLHASRARRAELLGRLDAGALVTALPLWVGTLRDVEDLLPADPGMFDLVILDEAVQVDQFRAAGSLLRAKRAVVVGDPNQLRHVSFVADDDVSKVVSATGVGELADRLDVRRQSIYDVAAGAGRVTFLEEHHRSVPHLIEFSNKRFYGGRIKIATRTPFNESLDAIDVVHVAAVADEVGAAVDRVAHLIELGFRSIGLFTPFRSHADAVQAALLARFDPEVLFAHGVRAGTAHSAQGSERDHVIIPLGLAADDPAGRWRFVEDPNLFNVLVTRARREVVVVTALPEVPTRPGIVADYLRHAAIPPPPPPGTAPRSPWIAELAAELTRNGVACRTGYPVGRWEVDIAAGTGGGAVALDCEVHPEGPDAHMARHRTLRRAGWRTLDAFASRWDGSAARAAVELSEAIQARG